MSTASAPTSTGCTAISSAAPSSSASTPRSRRTSPMPSTSRTTGWRAQFWKPAVIGPMTDFTFGVETYRETTDAYQVTATGGEAGLTQEFSNTLSGGLVADLESAEVDNAIQLENEYLIATLTGTLDWDRRDNSSTRPSGFRNFFTAAPAYNFDQEETVRDLPQRLLDLPGARRRPPLRARRPRPGRRDHGRGHPHRRPVSPALCRRPVDRRAATPTRASRRRTTRAT